MRYSLCIIRPVLFYCCLGLFLLLTSGIKGAEPLPPSGLMTDLLEKTDRVWIDGLPTQLTLANLPETVERVQIAEIRSEIPSFSWIVNDKENDVMQTAFEFELGTDSDFEKDDTLIWRSGKIESDVSSSWIPEMPPLLPETLYYWRVRTWNNGSISPWSEPRAFKTAARLYDSDDRTEVTSSFDGPVSRYPVVLNAEEPVLDSENSFDFGRDAFAYLTVTISNPVLPVPQSDSETERFAVVRLGERLKNGRVDRDPAGSTRYKEYRLPLLPGTETYRVKNLPDKRNTAPGAVRVPDYIGELLPFRYAEIEFSDPSCSVKNVTRYAAHYPFDESVSYFHSDSDELNQVWELCRYSMKATSFAGIFVDGDRERIPYEGDALLNQLGYYAVDREYSLARLTEDYLIFHPTWPTEWILQTLCMAWNDWLWTADSRLAERRYNDLYAKSLLALAGEDGLISTRGGTQTREILDTIHFSGKEIRDIVDWPHKGLSGNENADSGETDGFVFCDKNVVVNAYYYAALSAMERFALLLHKNEDAEMFAARLAVFKESFQRLFFVPETGLYRDGNGTDHVSLHGNMFPLAFGLVSDENRKAVADFVRSRGMKCSVYGSQFLLDALYEGNDGDGGFRCMTDDGTRSWLNMIRVGATISLEAWDDRYKPNQDWNHAWGAAPANIIPRRLVGVEPTEPAFAKMRIKPQIAELSEIDAAVPTIRGTVAVSVRRTVSSFSMTLKIPANTRAEVWFPLFENGGKTVFCDGKPVETERCGNFRVLSNVGSGNRFFEVK